LHGVYDWHRISTALWMPLMEVGDFPMMRRMLRGIRERAEAERHRRHPRGSTRTGSLRSEHSPAVCSRRPSLGPGSQLDCIEAEVHAASAGGQLC
jgi:hypothetical protein